MLQVVVGVLSLSLSFLRDCRLEREEYWRSANAINYVALACASVVAVLNILISAFDPLPH